LVLLRAADRGRGGRRRRRRRRRRGAFNMDHDVRQPSGDAYFGPAHVAIFWDTSREDCVGGHENYDQQKNEHELLHYKTSLYDFIANLAKKRSFTAFRPPTMDASVSA
jgi:hypothetical protein